MPSCMQYAKIIQYTIHNGSDKNKTESSLICKLKILFKHTHKHHLSWKVNLQVNSVMENGAKFTLFIEIILELLPVIPNTSNPYYTDVPFIPPLTF